MIVLDGDLQHEPIYIPDLIKEAARGSDLVMGYRRRSREMPWDRKFSNWSTSSLLSIISGKTIRDGQCGYRMLNLELLKKINLTTIRYDLETELLLEYISAGAKLGWVPISTKYHGESSSINRLADTARFLEVVVKHLFK